MLSSDYNNYHEIERKILEEFANFDLKEKWPNFSGGRFKTEVPGVWAHIDVNGQVRRIEINKPEPNNGTIWFKVS